MGLLAVTDDRYILGEGPQWNASEQTVSWVDIEGRTLSAAKLGSRGKLKLIEQRSFDDRIGFAHPLGDGHYLIGLGRCVAISAPDGVVQSTGPLVAEGRRLNDSVIDPAGCLIVGGLSLETAHESNRLLRINSAGTVDVLDDDLRLSNGLAFSPDGGVLYSIDSLRHGVFRRSYDAATGRSGEREVVATFGDLEPDGMAVDDAGDLWVAVWGGGGIQRIRADGSEANFVEVGPSHVTSLAFSGPGLDVAVVTTSHLLLDDDERRQSPNAGAVVTMALGVTGLLPHLWKPLDLHRVTVDL